MTYCQLDLLEQTSVKYKSKLQNTLTTEVYLKMLTKCQPFCSGLNVIDLCDFMMNYQLKFIELNGEVSLESIEIIEANECVVYDYRFKKYWLRLHEGYPWYTIWGNMGATQIWNTEISFSSVVMSWKGCEIRPSLTPVYMWERWRFIEKILSPALTKLPDDLFQIFFFQIREMCYILYCHSPLFC